MTPRLPYSIDDNHARLYVDRDGNLLVETPGRVRRFFGCGVNLVTVNDGTIFPNLDMATSLINIAALSGEIVAILDSPMVGDIKWPANASITPTLSSVTLRLKIGAPDSAIISPELDAVHLSAERMHPNQGVISPSLQAANITLK